MVAVVPRTGVEMNMIFSKVRVERNVQRFQEKRKNGMNAKFSAKCVALIAAGAMSMSLAACSGGSMDDSSSSNGSAANSDTITLGSVTTNSGTAAAYGEAEVAGFKLAVDEINAKGGINGKQVKVLEYDDKGDGVEAVNAYNLACDNGITAVFGATLTGPTIALADATYEDNMPQVTASATASGVTMIDPDDPDSEIRQNVFRACFIDPYQGKKMADYAVEKLSAKTAAIFYQTGSDYSEGLMNAFAEEAKAIGLEIVDTEAFAEGDKDFKAQMTNIAAAAPDVVFAPIYYAEAGLAITAARAAGCTATFMGGDGFGSVKNYASADDLEGSVYCSGYAPGTDSVKQFEEDYKAAYNVDEIPNMFAPLAYDAAMLLCEGLKAAEAQGLTAGTDEYKQAVIDAIKTMDGTEGITGSYAFDEFNNPIKPVAIIELTGGNEVYQEMF